MNTIQTQAPVDGRRRRRLHSDEFKANSVASCTQPGMSMAAVAMANGVNANLLRRWVREAELRCGGDRPDAPAATLAPPSVATPAFVPLPLPARSMSPDIRIELRRGATSVTVFANIRGTRMKLLVHDGFGVWCAARRLNKGRFVWPDVKTGALPQLTQAQFDALVLGLPWQRLTQLQTLTHV